jgi:zinc protease
MTTAPHPGLAPERRVLANGVTVIAKHTTATPAVSFSVSLPAGVMHEDADQAGVAILLARTIDRGTARRSAEEIAEALDGRGVALDIAMNRHNITLGCTCLSGDTPALLDVVLDIVRGPIFPSEEVALRRQEIVTGLRQDEDNPAVRSIQTLLGMIYGDRHPYGRRPRGTVGEVERLEREHVAAFHARRVTPAGVTLVIVGDIDPARAMDLAGGLLDSWAPVSPPTPVALPPVTSPTARRRTVVPMMNKSQADIAYGFPTVVRSDPAFYAFWIMNTALGQYALGGRLGDNIRERQGMAYYVFSSFDPAPVPAPLIVRAGVAADDVDRAISAIDEEIAALARDGLTAEEMDDTRRFLIASMPRLLETNADIAAFLQTVEFFELGMDHDVRLAGLLQGVTRDDVLAAARQLDPALATIAVAGPYEDRGATGPSVG